MTELAEFYAARLDERERIALAAGGGRWTVPDAGHRPGPALYVEDDQGEMIAEGIGAVNPAASLAHITLNDPAQALREVEAGRKILAEHRQGDNDSIWCWRCDPDSDVDSSPAYYPCLTLRAAASAFSGHPAYKEEWKP